MAWVYMIARPGVGAMVADIQFQGDMSTNPLDAWYIDIQHQLPLPDKFDNFSLPNGLSFKASDIRRYRLDYVGIRGTELHLDVNGLMEPFDINDTSMDPLAAAQPAEGEAKKGFWAGYSSHFDMTVRVTGKLIVRGQSFDVDCVSTMDHSWGPRAERGMRPMSWINAHFGEDYALQSIWSYSPRETIDKQFKLAHGYALVNGKVKGFTDGKMCVVRNKFDRFGVAFETWFTDIDGQEHYAFGSPLSQHPWSPYGCTYVPNYFLRWQSGSRIGYGNSQENNPLDTEAGTGQTL